MEKPYRRGGLVGPILLIAGGLILLLNNLGILSYSIWALLLQVWPILLIAVGIDLLVGRRSAWGALLSFLLIVALIGGAIWLVALPQPSGSSLAGETVSQPLGEANAADLTLIPAVGSVRVASSSSPTLMLQGSFFPLPGERIVHTAALQGDTELMTIRSTGISAGVVARPASGYNWDVDLNRRVPAGLHVQLGIGQADLDLTDLSLSDLDFSGGIGQFTVDLPAQGRFAAKISGGFGQLVVSIPPGMEARIHVSAALAGRSIPSLYQPEGDFYVSPGYATADNRVDLDLTMAFGNLVVR